MIIEQIQLKRGIAIGLNFEMQRAPLLVIKATRGFAMCGYLDMATAEKLGDVAIRVSGVSTFDDVLAAEVKSLTSKAKELGITVGMKARDALELMF
ncbi:YunC family protein [Methanomethylovorans sp.]|uniref:YunC family protein n=1 Tax=Methanomethylovorans sp. TaxID=2758717 RepID=UPI00351C4842